MIRWMACLSGIHVPCYLQHGALFYWHIYENMQQSNNKVDNYEALYCTMVLLLLELGGEEVLLELVRLALDIQVCIFLCEPRN